MHKALERQLIRCYGSLQNVPEEQRVFLEQVNKTYTESDQEYSLMERALDISSKELTEANVLLREEKKEIEKKVKDRTKELSQEKSKLNRIAQNMNTGAILFNKNGQVTFINNKAREIIKFDDMDDSLVLEKLFNKFEGFPVEEYLERCMAGETLKIPEAEVSHLIFELLFQSLLISDGEDPTSFGHLIWIRDITEEKLLDRSKSELVAIASHQLRTPLTVTKGNVEMLLDESFGKLNDEQREVLAQTAESNENLISLVNQMLDITKIEKGNLYLNLKAVSLDVILEKIVDDLSVYAKTHNVLLKFDKPKVMPKVLADNDRLYQVFQNLIENAIQYCHNDKDGVCPVNISVGLNPDKINIKISDLGIGIPKQEQEKIFGMFYRASNAVNLISSRTGLGLYIVKSIVELFGGTIRFESEENNGTTFYIELPVVK
ncbi:HAMP domain-containing histidine kinase [Patescibacteria group bacterium]|nr:HAMP domain-containing histidine kinase [Patescibacteria group bacterium]